MPAARGVEMPRLVRFLHVNQAEQPRLVRVLNVNQADKHRLVRVLHVNQADKPVDEGTWWPRGIA